MKRSSWSVRVLKNEEEIEAAQKEKKPAILFVNGQVVKVGFSQAELEAWEHSTWALCPWLLQDDDEDPPDDTALPWDEWNAKVDQVLRECEGKNRTKITDTTAQGWREVDRRMVTAIKRLLRCGRRKG